MKNRAGIVLCLLHSHLLGAVWIGGGDDWLEGANWSGGRAPDGTDPVWDIPGGAVVTAELTTGEAWVDKRGEGELRLRLGENPVFVDNHSGHVALSGDPVGLSMTFVRVAGGSVGWAAGSTLGYVELDGGGIEPGSTGNILSIGVVGSASADLSAETDLSLGTLLLGTSGSMTLGAGVSLANANLLAGSLDLAGGRVNGEVLLIGGSIANGNIGGSVQAYGGNIGATVERTLEINGGRLVANAAETAGLSLRGGTLAGDLVVRSWLSLDSNSGPFAIEGASRLAAGVEMTWLPFLAEACLSVSGSLMAEAPVPLRVEGADWTSPYWDESRSFLVIDAYEGGVVDAAFLVDPDSGQGEGAWTQERGADGDLILRWSPGAAAGAAGMAVVPEPSALGAISSAAALALAFSARRRRARPR